MGNLSTPYQNALNTDALKYYCRLEKKTHEKEEVEETKRFILMYEIEYDKCNRKQIFPHFLKHLKQRLQYLKLETKYPVRRPASS